LPQRTSTIFVANAGARECGGRLRRAVAAGESAEPGEVLHEFIRGEVVVVVRLLRHESHARARVWIARGTPE
jgi:hypothetical protein